MLTAQQIVTLATQAARVPGYTSQAGQWLNIILQEMCQDHDFDVIKKAFYFNFNPGLVSVIGNSIYGSGPYPLPADFLRCAGNKSVFWTLLGVPYPLVPIDLSEFDMAVQQAGIQSYPYWFCTDVSLNDAAQQDLTTPVAYVYAPPSGAYPCTVRYYPQMPDIPAPETSTTVPWFPNQAYLIKRLTAQIMDLANDPRAPEKHEEARQMLEKYLKMKDDKEDRTQTVQLDRRRFGPDYSRLRNTKLVGW